MNDLVNGTELRRRMALESLDDTSRRHLGQYFTPARAASLIASMARSPSGHNVRILDPGAGVGSLSAAVVTRMLNHDKVRSIELVAVEVDEDLAPYLESTLTDCREAAREHGISLTTRLIVGDYVDLATSLLSEEPSFLQPFDLVVMNPPYRKLGARSAERKALTAHGVDCPNLYAAFLALGIMALRPGGQIVAITPRSFANGSYFAPFRRFMLSNVAFDHIHIFESRSTVFADTGVLQENVIIAATKGKTPENVTISVSNGHHDDRRDRIVEYKAVVRPDDKQQFIRIPLDHEHAAAAGAVTRLPCDLASLGLDVSTGKVVAFRCRPNLRSTPDESCIPLVYPGNIRSGVVQWPRAIRKPQGFTPSDDATQRLLLPAGRYVVVKRFSSKEERRRVVAAVWDPDHNPRTPVAFENHLNILHRGGSGLDRDLAVGMSLWLNSSIVDLYFRTFSGHTQVNASDLRSLRFPSEESLRSLGAGQPLRLPDQELIDTMVNSLLLDSVGSS